MSSQGKKSNARNTEKNSKFNRFKNLLTVLAVAAALLLFFAPDSWMQFGTENGLVPKPDWEKAAHDLEALAEALDTQTPNDSLASEQSESPGSAQSLPNFEAPLPDVSWNESDTLLGVVANVADSVLFFYHDSVLVRVHLGYTGKPEQPRADFYFDSNTLSSVVEQQIEGPESDRGLGITITLFSEGEVDAQHYNLDCAAPMATDYLAHEEQRLLALAAELRQLQP